MKITRQKKAKKTLGFYVNNFRFHEPYQVLIEGTFTYGALKNKVQITEQIPKYLQGEIKFLTTKCLIMELDLLAQQNRKLEGALKILKKFAVHQCGHKESVTGAKCVKDMLKNNNPSRYIVATQDRSLQEVVRKTAATPLLYLHVQTPTLDPPSQADQQHAEHLRNNLTLTSDQETTLKKMKENAGIVEVEQKMKKKKKKKGGPNPLSCLKKKKNKKPQQPGAANKKVEAGNVEKPQRKRVKIAAHVKEELMKQIISEREKSKTN